MQEPELKRLANAITSLAALMGELHISTDDATILSGHLLFNRSFHVAPPKNRWDALASGLITERELRNFFIAHVATKIAHMNNVPEPSTWEYLNREICHEFEYALFGRNARVLASDALDPWEHEQGDSNKEQSEIASIPQSLLIAVSEKQIAAIDDWWNGLTASQREEFVDAAVNKPVAELESLSVHATEEHAIPQNDWYEYVVNQDARFYFDRSNGVQTSHGFKISSTIATLSIATDVKLVSHILSRTGE